MPDQHQPHPPTARLVLLLGLMALAGAPALHALLEAQTRTARPARRGAIQVRQVRQTPSRPTRCGTPVLLVFEACQAVSACEPRRLNARVLSPLYDRLDEEIGERTRSLCSGLGCGNVRLAKDANAFRCASRTRLCATRQVEATCEPTRAPRQAPRRVPSPSEPKRVPSPTPEQVAPPRAAPDGLRRVPDAPRRTSEPRRVPSSGPVRTAPLTASKKTPPLPPGAIGLELFRSAQQKAALLASLNGQVQALPPGAIAVASTAALEFEPQRVAAPTDPAGFLERSAEATPVAIGGAPGALQIASGAANGGTGTLGAPSAARWVERFVCCDGFSLLSSAPLPPQNPFSPTNLGPALARNERLLVFDDLPIVSGQQVLVPVQRTTGARERGYFPLFWLYQRAAPEAAGQLFGEASYMLMAEQLYNVAQDTFYAACDGINPLGGEVPITASLPADRRYACGEYPAGDTSKILTRDGKQYKLLFLLAQELDYQSWENPETSIGYSITDLGAPPIDFGIPIYLGRVASQQRSASDYEIRNLATGVVVKTPTYSQTPYAAQDAARVHPMDWWFRFGYPGGVEHPTEVEFEFQLHLPGVEILAAPFHKVIIIRTKGLVERETRISDISLGRIRVDAIPVRVRGRLVRSSPTGTLVAPGGGAPRARIEFTDFALLRTPVITFPDSVEIAFSQRDPLHDAVIDATLNVLNGLLHSSLGGQVGALLWESYVEKSLVGQVESLMRDIAPRLSWALPRADEKLIAACDRLFPAAQKTTASPFYALYRECLGVAGSAVLHLFHDDGVNTEGSQPQFAQVAAGGVNWGLEGTEKHYFPPIGFENESVVTLQRPAWARYDPQYQGSTYTSGKAVTSSLDLTANEDYWPLLQCLAATTMRVFNYDPNASPGALGAQLRAGCLEAGVETACRLYGDSEDLLQIWEDRWGGRPPDRGYTSYCAWLEEMRRPDTPDLKLH